MAEQPRRNTASRPRLDDVARDLELPEVLGQFPDKVPEEILRSGRRGAGSGRGPVANAVGDGDIDPGRQSGDDVVERRVQVRDRPGRRPLGVTVTGNAFATDHGARPEQDDLRAMVNNSVSRVRLRQRRDDVDELVADLIGDGAEAGEVLDDQVVQGVGPGR